MSRTRGPYGSLQRNQAWLAWCGVAGMVLVLLGMLVAKFIPPPGPDHSLKQIVAIYDQDATRIHVGLIIATVGATLLGPWVIALAMGMKRAEGDFAPLAWLQVLLGALLVFEFFMPTMIWQAAAFRPLSNPDITYRLHDLGSLTFVALPWTGMLQAITLGIGVLQDRSPEPVFPRWVAYLSFWAALGFLPGGLNPLAHSGPIAWSGVLAWWMGLSIFGIWIAVVTWCLLRRPVKVGS